MDYFRAPLLGKLPMGWYRSWFGTRYYALLYGHRNGSDAQDWVDAIVKRWYLPQGAELLDMACGRGRHAGCFHEQGLRVTGIDISPESIAEARSLHPGVEFHVHDMREHFADQRFDAVTCLFTSLGYFDTMEDDQLALDAAFRALRPGGRFVVDFMNSPRVLKELVPHERFTRENVHFEITRTVERNTIVKHIRVTDGPLVEEFEERVQALLPEEIEMMAKEAGFELMGRTDGPETTPYSAEASERCVLWMKRPDR